MTLRAADLEWGAATLVDATTNNRPSTVREKRRCLAGSILPALGALPLADIGARQIEHYKAARLASTTCKGTKPQAKTINEELAILGKILRLAHEWGEIEKLPPIKRLKVRPPDFDFLDFDEAERLMPARPRCRRRRAR